MRKILEMYGNITSSPYEELAYVGTEDLRILLADSIRYFLDDMRDDREVVFRADMRVTPADPQYRAGLIPGPDNPEVTLHLRGGVAFGRYENDYLIDITPVTNAVISSLRSIVAPYIDNPAAVTVDIVLQAEPSDGMHDLPSGWEQPQGVLS